MSDIRGYDTTNMNAGVYITEAQNLDINLMKIALQRIGKTLSVLSREITMRKSTWICMQDTTMECVACLKCTVVRIFMAKLN